MMKSSVSSQCQRIRGLNRLSFGSYHCNYNIPVATAAISPCATTSRPPHGYRTNSTVRTTNESGPNNNHTTAATNDAAVSIDDAVQWTYRRRLIRPGGQVLSPRRTVPPGIIQPLYATTGDTISSPTNHKSNHNHQWHHPTSPRIPLYHLPADHEFIDQMRHAGQIAATTLRIACDRAQRLVPTGGGDETGLRNATTTDDIDALVHDTIVQQFQAYPSPLNYATYPKSVCTSVNEIICHGIPECSRELQYGDVIAIDVSCYTQHRVHGDNCATVIVGDYNDQEDPTTTSAPSSSSSSPLPQCDWRNVPYRTKFKTDACYQHFRAARRLMQATREALMTAISIIRPNESHISDIGRACQRVAEQYGYSSVTKYRGHGIGAEFHCAPFIKHYFDDDENASEEPTLIRDGMIFTIEPMLCQYRSDCAEWETDHWTVTTLDAGLSCQFEHTVYITKTGVEILTLPLGHASIGRDYVGE